MRVLRSTEVMAAIQATCGRLEVDDLGPAKFDCVVAKPETQANPRQSK